MFFFGGDGVVVVAVVMTALVWVSGVIVVGAK